MAKTFLVSAMTLALLLTASVAVAADEATKAPDQPASTAESAAPAQPTADSTGLEVTIEPQAKEFVAGQPMLVKWSITNVSKTDKIIAWHPYFPVDFLEMVKGGSDVPDLGRTVPNYLGAGPPMQITLNPGEARSVMLDLEWRYRFGGFGAQTCEIIGGYDPKHFNDLRWYLNKPEFSDVVSSRIDSAPVLVKILKGEAKSGQPKVNVTPDWAEIVPETTPRKVLWTETETSFFKTNIYHPPLYYDSLTEKVALNDAAYRNLPGVAATTFYDWCQFPIQLVGTPALIFIKPFWQMERAQP